ncbi:hypothetical protein ASPWEDRAFT_64252 [Aspergillus wentii DTO 134E9]|uniref:Uncharacterized protein n=1 Tax=Aspergillus wentii DTO 134E9 TaxID=1073089 RepID=A0A1L9S147_ASPWE|nr:uncharacterized protein ASPWEDRAFT_64252 [Aspergillus wentii DTO 134E9]OJJ40915.1 hypothetical protein ASPWEDRAFT_64252 [Aspergillus wentii DTO 134E9]
MSSEDLNHPIEAFHDSRDETQILHLSPGSTDASREGEMHQESDENPTVAGQKTQWRQCKTVEEFSQLSKQPKEVASTLKKLMEMLVTPETEIITFVQEQAPLYLHSVQKMLQDRRLTGISWRQLSGTNDNIDNVVSIYPHFLAISGLPSEKSVKNYHDLLCVLFPERAIQQYNPIVVSEAFFQEPIDATRDIAPTVYEETVLLYRKYNPALHLAPYTSWNGPSGIGKSKTTEQISDKNLNYVVYASLAKPDSGAYPERSPIANNIRDLDSRDTMTCFFECFLAASLVNVELCRERKISPRVFFQVQVRREFIVFNQEIASCIKKFADQVWDTFEKSSDQAKNRIRSYRMSTKDNKPGSSMALVYQTIVDEHLDSYRHRAENCFSSLVAHLENFPRLPIGNRKEIPPLQEPAALICLDEAGELFADDDSERFLALRRAMRDRMAMRHKESKKTFFAILLDTSYRLSLFLPPRGRDPSLKYLRPGHLLGPIFQINTFDLFGSVTDPDVNIDAAQLFSLGRPLWGTWIRKFGLEAAKSLARSKICGGDPSPQPIMTKAQALALLSYRVNFYVVHHELAEELTSQFLRYIVGVNKDRTLVQTLQPSEPILAWASTQVMMSPQSRLQVVKRFFDAISEGSINTGDTGEMVAALLMFFAFDHLHGTENPKLTHAHRFLSGLLPDQIIQEIKARQKDSSQINTILSDGMIFFNHAIRMREPPTKDTLRDAFLRGAIIYPEKNFAGTDIIIPVFLPHPKTLSCILVQVKNCLHFSITTELRANAFSSFTKTERVASAFLDDAFPYIGIFMSLRSLKSPAAEVIHPTPHGAATRATTTTDESSTNKQKTGLRKMGSTIFNKTVSFGVKYEKSATYGWTPRHKVIVVTSGLDTRLFPGIGFPEEHSGETETEEILTYLESPRLCQRWAAKRKVNLSRETSSPRLIPNPLASRVTFSLFSIFLPPPPPFFAFY